jgi:hypothetical protein
VGPSAGEASGRPFSPPKDSLRSSFEPSFAALTKTTFFEEWVASRASDPDAEKGGSGAAIEFHRE